MEPQDSILFNFKKSREETQYKTTFWNCLNVLPYKQQLADLQQNLLTIIFQPIFGKTLLLTVISQQ